MMPLTLRQARFAREYLLDGNATRAAIRAGYSAKTANQQGSRLLANVGVSSEIAAARERVLAELGVTADRVLRELGRVAFSDLTELFDEDEGSSPRTSGLRTPPQQYGP
jgi:phage terminase small subunit